MNIQYPMDQDLLSTKAVYKEIKHSLYFTSQQELCIRMLFNFTCTEFGIRLHVCEGQQRERSICNHSDFTKQSK